MKKNKSHIKAILFDIGGVIVKKKTKQDSFLKALCKKYDMPYQKVARTYRQHKHAHRRGELSTNQFWQLVFNAGNKPIDIPGAFETYMSIRELVPGIMDILKKLHDNPTYTLVLANNQGREFDYARDKKFNFLKYFDYRASSWITGREKPDPLFFKALLEMTGFTPNECIYIDDNPLFIASAKTLGIQGIVFKNSTDLYNKFVKMGLDV